MTDTPRRYDIQHDEARQRFETTVEGHVCVADYQLTGAVMRITHTKVHASLEGRGIASALMQAALAHARSHGLKVDPQCPFARAYMERHPDTQDLRA